MNNDRCGEGKVGRGNVRQQKGKNAKRNGERELKRSGKR